MAETLIKIDLSKSPQEHDNIHNRWHPDVPMVATVKPGSDFIVECMDWTGGQIGNNDSAEDVRDVTTSAGQLRSKAPSRATCWSLISSTLAPLPIRCGASMGSSPRKTAAAF